MPYSSFIFDDAIAEIIKLVRPKTFLDLGAGAGKYGSIVKEINPSIETIAVEVEKDYLEKFNLRSIYHEIWNAPVINLIRPEYLDSRFDIVMAGDIFEHLKKSEGIDLLNFLIYRSRWIIVEFPHRYLQNAVDGYNSEAHISVWTEDDFLSFERTRMYAKDTQRLIILRGYLENAIPVEKIELTLNKYEKQ
jgi:predicted nicotinamide N-methyase